MLGYRDTLCIPRGNQEKRPGHLHEGTSISWKIQTQKRSLQRVEVGICSLRGVQRNWILSEQPGIRIGKLKYLTELNLARDVKGVMKSSVSTLGRLGKMWTLSRRKREP